MAAVARAPPPELCTPVPMVRVQAVYWTTLADGVRVKVVLVDESLLAMVMVCAVPPQLKVMLLVVMVVVSMAVENVMVRGLVARTEMPDVPVVAMVALVVVPLLMPVTLLMVGMVGDGVGVLLPLLPHELHCVSAATAAKTTNVTMILCFIDPPGLAVYSRAFA